MKPSLPNPRLSYRNGRQELLVFDSGREKAILRQMLGTFGNMIFMLGVIWLLGGILWVVGIDIF